MFIYNVRVNIYYVYILSISLYITCEYIDVCVYIYIYTHNHCPAFELTLDIFPSQPVKVVQYNINTEELYSYLKEFIHMLYFR